MRQRGVVIDDTYLAYRAQHEKLTGGIVEHHPALTEGDLHQELFGSDPDEPREFDPQAGEAVEAQFEQQAPQPPALVPWTQADVENAKTMMAAEGFVLSDKHRLLEQRGVKSLSTGELRHA